MPTKRAKAREASLEDVIDHFENWLDHQTPKPARAKHGFIAEEKIEASA